MTKSTLNRTNSSLSLCQACPVYMGFADEDDIPECVECRYAYELVEIKPSRRAQRRYKKRLAKARSNSLLEAKDEELFEIKPSRRAQRRQNKRLAKARANFLLPIIEAKYEKASKSKINSDEEARLIKKCVSAGKKSKRNFQGTFCFNKSYLAFDEDFKVGNDEDSIKKLMDYIPSLKNTINLSGKIISAEDHGESIKVKIGFYTKEQFNEFKMLVS